MFKFLKKFFILCLIFHTTIEEIINSNPNIPLIVVTWDYHDATEQAWKTIYEQKLSAIDAIEVACTNCEDAQCRKTVGFGGSPDENGETTLDALIMDGVTMDVGAVAGIRNVKNAASVARKVLNNTMHSILAGNLATQFAVNMGYKYESLQTNESKDMWLHWKKNKCQPNFWKNVKPDPSTTCGPYEPLTSSRKSTNYDMDRDLPVSSETNHDTIGVIAIDSNGNIAGGTSTNGAKYKIPGRIGDSPIPGAGAYADNEVGAASATGDGDVMLRFSPSFLAVEEMRRGASPTEAATTAIERIAKYYPKFMGAVIALNKNGDYGAACNGMEQFPFYIANPISGSAIPVSVPCISSYYVMEMDKNEF